jgi:hypothetical protein
MNGVTSCVIPVRRHRLGVSSSRPSAFHRTGMCLITATKDDKRDCVYVKVRSGPRSTGLSGLICQNPV